MDSDPATVRNQLQRQGVVLDTPVLLVVCVGLYDPNLLVTFKRTNTFDESDYSDLLAILGLAKTRYVTPQILAELTNHLNQLSDPAKTAVFRVVQEFVHQQFEVYIPKEMLIIEPSFMSTGFTDTSILRLCREKKCVLITTDVRLAGILTKANLYAVNYRNIQGQKWFGT